jgi:hypothetical protein
MTMSDDLDPTRNYHRGDLQSEEAFASLSGATREVQRQRIWSCIDSRGATGATCDEVEISTGLSHQTASARFTELHYRDLSIRRTGGTRPTRNDRKAWVYVVINPGSPGCGCGRHETPPPGGDGESEPTDAGPGYSWEEWFGPHG